MAKPASVNTVVKKPTLLPRFVSNSIETLNVLSDAALRGAQGIERVTIGIDDVATAMLKKQHQALLSELGE